SGFLCRAFAYMASLDDLLFRCRQSSSAMVSDPIENRTHADYLVVDVPGANQSMETIIRSGDRSSRSPAANNSFRQAISWVVRAMDDFLQPMASPLQIEPGAAYRSK